MRTGGYLKRIMQIVSFILLEQTKPIMPRHRSASQTWAMKNKSYMDAPLIPTNQDQIYEDSTEPLPVMEKIVGYIRREDMFLVKWSEREDEDNSWERRSVLYHKYGSTAHNLTKDFLIDAAHTLPYYPN